MAKLLPAVLAFLACCFFSPAHAAGFDCAKASSAVEKLICATPELSTLDSEMAEAYKAALTHTDVPKVLAASQKSWLGWRHACLDKGLPDADAAACLSYQYRGRIDFLTHPKFCRISRLQDCDDTNQLMGPDLAKTLSTFLPHNRKTADDVAGRLGGPPEDLQTLPNGWKLAAACRPHDCGSKAAILLTPAGEIMAAATLTIGIDSSSGLKIWLRAEEDRVTTVEALEGWAKDKSPNLAETEVRLAAEP